MKSIILIVLIVFLSKHTYSQTQETDSILIKQSSTFNYKALIIPTALITYGVISLESHTLKNVNSDIKEEVNDHIDNKLTIDDVSQYLPFLSVYGLNAVGIKGKHNLKDRTIILGTAYLIMGATVNIIKHTGNVERPDGSSTNSFPSGHTATAFMGAEFLFQEYKEVSVWYGISGYIVATGTGLFRVYNDRHWLSDVAAGAGIGILSTKIAYWLYPLLKKSIFKDKKQTDGLVMPFYNGKQVGLGLSMSF